MGAISRIAVDGPVRSNDIDVLIECAERDLGLAYVTEHEVRSQLRAGKLETVLDSYCPEVPGLFLYYPRAAQRVPKLAGFAACARDATSRAKR